ncbi:MAG: class I SAM-dependent methyltransferase [Anaerolineae bacterium]
MAETREERWVRFYKASEGTPAWPALVSTLERCEAETPGVTGRFAIDLGCGAGRDTLELLRRGWRVLAMDKQPEAIAHIEAAVPTELRGQLEGRVAAFEDITSLPPADLINAAFALPFCQPAHFPILWAAIVAALPPGGRFVGQLFGDRDEYAADPTMTFQTAEGVQELLSPFEIEHLKEREEDGKTALGEPKHWHVFSIVARKRPVPSVLDP